MQKKPCKDDLTNYFIRANEDSAIKMTKPTLKWLQLALKLKSTERNCKLVSQRGVEEDRIGVRVELSKVE